MTKEQAARRVTKLDAFANDRAATASEKKVAASKARKLRAEFDLTAHQTKPKPTFRHAHRSPPADWKMWTGDVVMNFDPSTGKATKGTKVHHYQGPGNWRIEVPL